MHLHKTEQARAEPKPGVRTLGQRERTLLLLADGTKLVQDFRPLFAGEGEQIALRTLRDGDLEIHGRPFELHTKPASSSLTATPAAAAQGRHHPSPETTPAIKASADQLDGKRSLATTRMFLFDICERMFARRNPQLAELFREALRNATDRDAMPAVSRYMMNEIEKVAGHERATPSVNAWPCFYHRRRLRLRQLVPSPLHLPSQERALFARAAEGAWHSPMER